MHYVAQLRDVVRKRGRKSPRVKPMIRVNTIRKAPGSSIGLRQGIPAALGLVP